MTDENTQNASLTGGAGQGENGGQQAPQAATGASWQDSLPESVRGWDEVKNSDSAEKFWGQVENMRGLIGRSLRIPSEEAGEEDWAKFRGKLKDVPGIAMLPAGEEAEQWKEFYGKVPEGVRRAWFDESKGEFLSADEAAAAEARSAAVQDGLRDLGKEWGNAFDDNLGVALQAVRSVDKKLGGTLVAALDATGIGNDPAMIRAFYEIGKMLGEEPMRGGGGSGSFAITPAEALERISEIQNNRQDPYHDAGHPKHRERVAHVHGLYEMAYPNSQSIGRASASA